MSRYWEQNMNSFAHKIYSKLSATSKSDDNIFFGPGCIYTALLMVYQGTRGEAAKELKKLLCLPEEETDEFYEEFAETWEFIIKNNSGNRGTILEIANRLWVKKGEPIEDDYQAKLAKCYKADVFNGVDFADDTEGARQMINKWIEKSTKEKICDMIKELSPTTNFMVVSAMYFFGTWKKEFLESKTKRVPFYVSKDETIEIDMMYEKMLMGYQDNEHYNCKVGVIPYKSSKLRMIIMCPNEIDGLAELERKLLEDNSTMDPEYEWDWTQIEVRREIHIHLPKFKISQMHDISKHMAALGVTELFSHPDLSGMTTTKDLALDSVAHASLIDVNEKGTEVAVVTTSMYKASGISIPLEVKCDRPFLFMIGCKRTDLILFMGRVCRPSY